MVRVGVQMGEYAAFKTVLSVSFSTFEHVGREVVEEVCRCGRTMVGELSPAVGRHCDSRERRFVDVHDHAGITNTEFIARDPFVVVVVPVFGDDWAIVDGSHDTRVGIVGVEVGTSQGVEQVDAESTVAVDQGVYYRGVRA